MKFYMHAEHQIVANEHEVSRYGADKYLELPPRPPKEIGVELIPSIQIAVDGTKSAYWRRVDATTEVVAARIDSEMSRLSAKVSHMLEEKAKAKGYDSAVSVVSYRGSTNPKFAKEAGDFVVWRDSVWNAVIARQEAIKKGTEPFTSVEDILATLPTIDW